LVVKGLMIADLATPMEHANRFRDEIAHGFFERADMTRVYGIVFQGDEKKKETVDREKSMLAFWNFLCTPLFKRVAGVFPILGLGVEQMRHNVRVWQAQLDEASSKT
jgi:3',5'-cyclic-nucleotide phosphodiesterase